MNKKEKAVTVCFVISFVLVLISCIFTLYQNKPKGQIFIIEKVIDKF